ncbi:MAG: hypothetical protein AAFY65_09510, partial [Pseudomonadota bacterium]
KSDYVAVFQGEQRALTVNDIELEKLPRTLVLQKSYKQIRDLCWAENAQFIITDPLRQIIEAHDPGQHIIWEQVIRTKRKGPKPGPFFGLIVGPRASAIVEEGDDLQITPEQFNEAIGTMPAYTSPRTARLRTYRAWIDPSNVPEQHLWWDEGLTYPYLLMSDTLHDAIVEAGLKVIPMKRCKEM